MSDIREVNAVHQYDDEFVRVLVLNMLTPLVEDEEE